ncbi:PKD domain-containing protein [Arthrobacter sp. TMT4-20]
MKSVFQFGAIAVLVGLIFSLLTAAPVRASESESGITFDESDVSARNVTRQSVSGSEGTKSTESSDASSANLPVDDGVDYTYERVCTAGAQDFMDPAYCVQLNAQCDAQADGVLVQWIEVNRNVSPPTRTATGRSGCLYPGAPPTAPTAATLEEAPIVITLTEFESQPIIAAGVFSQPDHFGLRNAHSNLYAVAQEQEFTFEFQNAQIRLRAWPVSYEWSYGDGSSLVTTDPGSALPGDGFDVETLTSHRYSETGDYLVGLDTLFAGDYSVDGGPWLPVAGQARVTSEPHLMSIWRSERHSVAETCLENPQGIGC